MGNPKLSDLVDIWFSDQLHHRRQPYTCTTGWVCEKSEKKSWELAEDTNWDVRWYKIASGSNWKVKPCVSIKDDTACITYTTEDGMNHIMSAAQPDAFQVLIKWLDEIYEVYNE